MKKITLFIAMYLCFQSFAQMTKAEVELALNAIPKTKMDKVYLDNKRTYYTDGSSKVVQSSYTYAKANLEPGENSLLLRYYKDDTKSTLSSISVMTYTSIESLVVTDTWIKIVFIGR